MSRLAYDNQDTGLNVPGYVLERQFKRNTGYFLITSCNYDLEDADNAAVDDRCWFLVLDENFKIEAQQKGEAFWAVQEAFPLDNNSLKIVFSNCFGGVNTWFIHIHNPILCGPTHIEVTPLK